MPRLYTVHENPTLSIHTDEAESVAADLLRPSSGRSVIRIKLGHTVDIFVTVDQAAAIHSGIAQAQDDLRVRDVPQHGDGVRAHAEAAI